ncbi:MAG TPA: SDR family NAD(P)-dependent oxidoreductase [Acidimicrobiales bacterium]|jgi:NAD(P)-dependent dehydrogenase (short-subunit alcohol dehydrogenase family)|nr:SDR family NAD(P)-dependent oxidoreductase [Acidimicrobiales bacterium]
MPSAERTVVVTGGTSGLGRECARSLAGDPGIQVVVTGRDLTRTQTQAASIGARPMVLDLASLASVRTFTQELIGAGLPPLRALVCNAGLQFTRRVLTEDKVEATFGINHLGHLALVEGLVPFLEAPARIVFVSSGTHDPANRTGMPHPLEASAYQLAYPPTETGGDSPGKDGRRRYATSKLANVRATYALARHLEDRGITVNAFDPGLMPRTGLARDAGPLSRALFATVARGLVVLPGVNTPERSGAALARLVTDPDLEKTTGTYFAGTRPSRSSVPSYDLEAQDALYRDSLDILATLGGLP